MVAGISLPLKLLDVKFLDITTFDLKSLNFESYVPSNGVRFLAVMAFGRAGSGLAKKLHILPM